MEQILLNDRMSKWKKKKQSIESCKRLFTMNSDNIIMCP